MNATEVQPCRYSMDFLEGSIFSPQYPYSYPSLVNCSYYFPNRNSMKLVLSLDYLDLNTDSCRADFIDIYQMQPKVCSTFHKYYFLSNKRILLLYFDA